MAIPLNGVMVSRVTGSLMPALAMNALRVSDCIVNTIKIDSGDKKIIRTDLGETKKVPIVSNPENLPIIHNGAWSLETELYANFNGDLEAGPLSFYGKTIDGVAVRRSSNRDNFSKWEDIKILRDIRKNNDNIDKIYNLEDKTIESGIWYKYAIQPMSGYQRGSLYKTLEKSVIYDSAFLVGLDGKQLNLKFDTTVTSLKRNIKEARVETIGSKYPFITRNASVDYREFPIAGLITHFMDDTKEFAPRAEMFVEDQFADELVDMTPEYDALFRAHGLNDYNNTTLEREFREKVHNFLVDGQPKLFKSPKVGNVLVRLMDVNLSSRQDINGGMVYTFSCTAVEIGEASIDNFDKYNIQKR